jgi:hypothetical protein
MEDPPNITSKFPQTSIAVFPYWLLGLLMVTMVVPFCGIGCRKGDSAEPAPLVEVSGLEFGKCLPDNELASGPK